MKPLCLWAIFLAFLAFCFLGCGEDTEEIDVVKNIVDEIITIHPDKGWTYEFIVTSEMKDVWVKGKFTVTNEVGGIKVHILDDLNYINLSKYTEWVALYDSGRVAVSEFEWPIIKTGTYYLLFENFSSLASRTVQVHVDLCYKGKSEISKTVGVIVL